MPDNDKRFEVRISLDIQEVTPNGLKPFSDSALNYHDLPYDGVLAVEQVLQDAQQKLINAGYAQAEAKGLGEKLKGLERAGILPPGLAKKDR